MAKQVLGPNTQITVNGTDLSQFCSNVSLSDSADDVDVTGFGETYREFLPGLKDAEIGATFTQAYGSGEVDAVLSAMYSASVAGTVKVKPDTAGTVVYTMISRLYQYGPVNGGVGDANSIDVTWRNAGTAGLTRGTA
jgi:diaminopimelate epimerase